MTDLLPGLTEDHLDAPRLRTALLSDGRVDGELVVFVHGNVSSSLFFQQALLALPEGFHGIAPDLRGFGASEVAPVDATRGLRDFSDDLLSLLDTLGEDRAHLVGWSMGGGVVTQLLLDRPALVSSLTLISPVSPYGFGATRGSDGERLGPDDQGAGGAGANPEFVEALQVHDATDTQPNSPRNVLNAFYFANGFRSPLEDVFVASMLTTAIGDDNYPGDSVQCDPWPGFGPGRRGVLNTMAPANHNVSAVVDLATKPRVLWVRGDKDLIVSDASVFDLATLGQMGAIPGWPGEEVAPPQPMVSQTRAVLDAYSAAGGRYTELTLDAGHSPHIERAEEFHDALVAHLHG